MSYKRLYIWVEGPDDYEFFINVIQPFFEQNHDYDVINIIKYAEQSNNWMKAFLNSIKRMPADYIFVADLDESPCITQKLDKLDKKYPFYERKNMQIVVEEIEGWYIAGLSKENSQQLKLKLFRDTNSLTKEQFDRLIPSKYDSRRDFMRELLKHFSMQTAVCKNKSFRHFVEKYNLEASV